MVKHEKKAEREKAKRLELEQTIRENEELIGMLEMKLKHDDMCEQMEERMPTSSLGNELGELENLAGSQHDYGSGLVPHDGEDYSPRGDGDRKNSLAMVEAGNFASPGGHDFDDVNRVNSFAGRSDQNPIMYNEHEQSFNDINQFDQIGDLNEPREHKLSLTSNEILDQVVSASG